MPHQMMGVPADMLQNNLRLWSLKIANSESSFYGGVETI